MKIALTVKNNSKVLQPIKNDVIIYDGSTWYVTTKEDILEETNNILKDCKAALIKIKSENNSLKEENAEFKKKIAEQMLKLSELVEKLYSSK